MERTKGLFLTVITMKDLFTTADISVLVSLGMCTLFHLTAKAARQVSLYWGEDGDPCVKNAMMGPIMLRTEASMGTWSNGLGNLPYTIMTDENIRTIAHIIFLIVLIARLVNVAYFMIMKMNVFQLIIYHGKRGISRRKSQQKSPLLSHLMLGIMKKLQKLKTRLGRRTTLTTKTQVLKGMIWSNPTPKIPLTVNLM